MSEIEYIAPSGNRYLVSAISDEFSMPYPGGQPGTARTVTARRWIKSRQVFAKTAQSFMTRSWDRWTEDHSTYQHVNVYDEETCEALGRALRP